MEKEVRCENGQRLMVLEVSQKQAYIFGTSVLSENAMRSLEIAFVTSKHFFSYALAMFDRSGTEKRALLESIEKKVQGYLIYSGGGHTFLRFPNKTEADYFAMAVTTAAKRKFPEMELYVKQIAYQKDKTIQENLSDLITKLEEKKALRLPSFRQIYLGIENQWKKQNPADCDTRQEFLSQFNWVTTSNDRFYAVVHIDGNAMGKRLNAIYEKAPENAFPDDESRWDYYNHLLQSFSEQIQKHFSEAYKQTIEYAKSRKQRIQKIIGAGDDICFITSGAIGLDCAAEFLHQLTQKTNGADGKNYSACAGVAIVHWKTPFWKAYQLSEELCSNAKRFAADNSRRNDNGEIVEYISAIDFHVQRGLMQESLAAFRKDFIANDGNHLELRPYAVCGFDPDQADFPLYSQLRERVKELNLITNNVRNKGNVSSEDKTTEEENSEAEAAEEERSGKEDREQKKVLAASVFKKLREDLGMGDVESIYAIRSRNLCGGLDASTIKLLGLDQPFQVFRGIKRCVLFDAIDLMDIADFGRDKFHE